MKKKRMLKIERTNSVNPVFKKLVNDLDKYLAITDGDDHAFYNQFNKLDDIKHALVLYNNEEPIGCGAIKEYDLHTFEVKRMYVAEYHRGHGYAVEILHELEGWAKDLGAQKCILETGVRQLAAIRLYEKAGFAITKNYGQYAEVEDSVCFAKYL
jgi:RimJ/RimL family protein N-acetyltransferase